MCLCTLPDETEHSLFQQADGASSLLPAGLSIIGAYVCSRQDIKPQIEAETLHKQCSAVCSTFSQVTQVVLDQPYTTAFLAT